MCDNDDIVCEMDVEAEEDAVMNGCLILLLQPEATNFPTTVMTINNAKTSFSNRELHSFIWTSILVPHFLIFITPTSEYMMLLFLLLPVLYIFLSGWLGLLLTEVVTGHQTPPIYDNFVHYSRAKLCRSKAALIPNNSLGLLSP